MNKADIHDRLSVVKQRINAAAGASQRAAETVRLLAVSKRQGIEKIEWAHAAGQRAFGESYVSEALEKMAELTQLDIEWHFIGPIQSNKTRDIANRFDWVHSVDRAKVLTRLGSQRDSELPALNICLQVKLGDEATKSGVPPDEVAKLVSTAGEYDSLRLRGLMCIPPASDDPKQQRHWFDQLAEIFAELKSAGHQLDTLSMGMSADLEAAIAAGSTFVRVGTDIFGKRAP